MNGPALRLCEHNTEESELDGLERPLVLEVCCENDMNVRRDVQMVFTLMEIRYCLSGTFG